ncbi:16S rRNA methyltransferase [Sulfolobus acidocaldarius SUSAZ]|nr:16S rRNA methyltransferase [Sulfolobus acidocaldarius SUSAZ]
MKNKLGQHFLNDISVIKKLISLVDHSTRPVIEVGSGNGVITKFLKPDIAIEIDVSLINHLRNYQLIIGDGRYLPTTRGQVVSSLPYYITTDFFHEVIKLDNIMKLVLIVQKDFIDKITSKSTLISYLLNYYYKISLFDIVPPSAFSPNPKVFSQLVVFDRARKYNKNISEIIECVSKYRNKSVKNALSLCGYNFELQNNKKVREFKPWEITDLLHSVGINFV